MLYPTTCQIFFSLFSCLAQPLIFIYLFFCFNLLIRIIYYCFCDRECEIKPELSWHWTEKKSQITPHAMAIDNTASESIYTIKLKLYSLRRTLYMYACKSEVLVLMRGTPAKNTQKVRPIMAFVTFRGIFGRCICTVNSLKRECFISLPFRKVMGNY